MSAPRATMADGARHVVLVGSMGAGKSTVGRALAAALGRPFVDADAEIEARLGRSIADIFGVDGEPAFRAEEAAVVGDLLAASPPCVLATGGGAVLDPGTRRALRSAATVWLRAEVATLVARVGTGVTRPLLAGDAAATLARLSEERSPLYAEVADLIVDVDGRSVSSVVDEILASSLGLEAVQVSS